MICPERFLMWWFVLLMQRYDYSRYTFMLHTEQGYAAIEQWLRQNFPEHDIIQLIHASGYAGEKSI